jgi:hypothetical protein
MAAQINIHHDEMTLARLARIGSEPDAHVAVCPRCGALYDFYRTYAAAEEQELNQPASERELERARDILTPGVFRLEPYRIQLDVRAPSASDDRIMLAALDDAGMSSRFVTVAAYASQAIQTVVRILHDTRTNRHTVHVLSADRSYSRSVGIGISDGRGMALQVITNDEGIGMLDSAARIDWATARLTLVTSSVGCP